MISFFLGPNRGTNVQSTSRTGVDGAAGPHADAAQSAGRRQPVALRAALGDQSARPVRHRQTGQGLVHPHGNPLPVVAVVAVVAVVFGMDSDNVWNSFSMRAAGRRHGGFPRDVPHRELCALERPGPGRAAAQLHHPPAPLRQHQPPPPPAGIVTHRPLLGFTGFYWIFTGIISRSYSFLVIFNRLHWIGFQCRSTVVFSNFYRVFNRISIHLDSLNRLDQIWKFLFFFF